MIRANDGKTINVHLGVIFLLTVLVPGCVDAGRGRETVAKPSPASRPNKADRLPSSAPKADKPRVVDFLPGIRIDYRVPQVEVDGKVILRQGELELFAYSKAPTPKEHETILLLGPRSESIYQALGLIGLKPGRPMSYDWETQVTTPPSGDPVDILIRYVSNGKTIEESACNWMWDVDRKAPMRKTHWLFAGSKRLEDGRFFADVDGTVVTVVNFDSALLTLPESHSDSNASLWLTAHTEAIPPLDTKVTLLLRPAEKR
ncbi:MAG: YdjY domain-containing protein [Phycisphaerales bacterium]|nr:YdjY domain-containing protein [Phycisphaerales bacterium]